MNELAFVRVARTPTINEKANRGECTVDEKLKMLSSFFPLIQEIVNF
jgi:hypothetical protein